MRIVDAYSSECVLAFVNKLTKKTPEGVYAGCVGVSKSYVEWYWKVEQCINNKCEQERRRDGDVLLNTLEDELNTRVPLLLKTKLTSILQPHMLSVWVVLHSGFTNILNKCTSRFNNSMSQVYQTSNNYRAQGYALRKIFREPTF